MFFMPYLTFTLFLKLAFFVLCQAGLRNIEVEPAPELHRAISGDLFSDEELDQATDEAAEE